MKRTLLYLLGGVVLGGIIHIVVILMLPQFAVRDIWARIGALDAVEDMVVLAPIAPGEDNPLQLDPALIHAVCQLSLADGPAIVNGTLPLAFWSLSIFNDRGHVIYSATSRSAASTTLDLGIFNAAQTRLLTEQPIEIEEGLLIAQSDTDDIVVAMHLAPSNEAVRDRYRQALDNLRCLNIR